MWRTRSAVAAAAVLIGVAVGVLFAFGVVGGDTKSSRGAATASATSQRSLDLPAVGDQCLVGTWRAQQTTTQTGITSPLVGGAGTIQPVGSDGSVVVDYANSAEWIGESDGKATAISKRGIEHHHVSASLDVYNTFGGDVSDLFTKQTFVVGQPLVIRLLWQDNARPYTCNATTLTIENAGSDPDVYDRVASQ
jgi:hypothetical protein